MGVGMRSTLGYGPSLVDQGISPEDAEYDDDRPHCSGCGAYLPQPSTLPFTYGYPGEEVTEQRWGSVCRRCKRTNWMD